MVFNGGCETVGGNWIDCRLCCNYRALLHKQRDYYLYCNCMHLAVVIADLATALAFCVPGIGILLGWAIGIMAGLAVFVYGAVFLYFLPFIMIPLVGFLGRHFL